MKKWGKTYNRVIALILSTIIVENGMILQTSAIKNQSCTFPKNHPIISSAIATVGAGSLIAAIISGSIELAGAAHASHIHTTVDKMSSTEINTYLQAEISKLKSRGKDSIGNEWFEVSETIQNEADPYVLALIVNAINQIFEKIPFLADVLKAQMQSKDNKFIIDWGSDNKKDYKRCSTDAEYGLPSLVELQGLGFARNIPHILIDKQLGTSMYKTKKRMANDLWIQREAVRAFGVIFDKNCIKNSLCGDFMSFDGSTSNQSTDLLGHVRINDIGLTIDDCTQVLSSSVNWRLRSADTSSYNRCFALLLSDYIFPLEGTYTPHDNEALRKIFEKYINALKTDFEQGNTSGPLVFILHNH